MFDLNNFEFIDIDHEKLNKYNRTLPYQNYIDKYQYNQYKNAKQIEIIRIFKDHIDEYKIALAVNRKLDKKMIIDMFNYVDNSFIIENIEKQWLKQELNQVINEYNMNSGTFEWFVKLKTKINVNENNYLIGGENNQEFSFIPNTNKLYINIIVDGKLYDKIYIDELNTDIINSFAEKYKIYLSKHVINKIINNNIYFI